MTDRDMPDSIYATGNSTMGSWNSDTVNGKHRQVHESEYLKSTPVREAAPELLEALVMFVDEYTAVNIGDAGFWDPEKEHKVIVARAAIAKARGQS